MKGVYSSLEIVGNTCISRIHLFPRTLEIMQQSGICLPFILFLRVSKTDDTSCFVHFSHSGMLADPVPELCHSCKHRVPFACSACRRAPAHSPLKEPVAARGLTDVWTSTVAMAPAQRFPFYTCTNHLTGNVKTVSTYAKQSK